jgi:hypothetical protein
MGKLSPFTLLQACSQTVASDRWRNLGKWEKEREGDATVRGDLLLGTDLAAPHSYPFEAELAASKDKPS